MRRLISVVSRFTVAVVGPFVVAASYFLPTVNFEPTPASTFYKAFCVGFIGAIAAGVIAWKSLAIKSPRPSFRILIDLLSMIIGAIVLLYGWGFFPFWIDPRKGL